MSAVRARAREGEVHVAVAINVRPLHAVIRLQLANAGRRHVLEGGAGVSEERVLPARAAGYRAVDVKINTPVMIEIGERARVVARIDRDLPFGAAILEDALAAIAQESEGTVICGNQVDPAVGIDVFGAHPHSPVAGGLRCAAAPRDARSLRDVGECACVIPE